MTRCDWAGCVLEGSHASSTGEWRFCAEHAVEELGQVAEEARTNAREAIALAAREVAGETLPVGRMLEQASTSKSKRIRDLAMKTDGLLDLLAHLMTAERKREAARRAAARAPLPCGTHAAFNRHKAKGEFPDDACVEAERQYQRARQVRRLEQRRLAA